MPAPNPLRGEAALGDYTLLVNFNGWCSLEGETGNQVPQLLQGLQEGLSFSELRTWVRVFISEPMSEEEAGEFIQEVGLELTLKALGKAVDGFFSAPAKKATPENPRKAA